MTTFKLPRQSAMPSQKHSMEPERQQQRSTQILQSLTGKKVAGNMLTKEYRVPLPLSLEEYRIAQLYMIQVYFSLLILLIHFMELD